MKKSKPKPLARRERQIMDVLYKLERATVGEVLAALPGPAASIRRCGRNSGCWKRKATSATKSMA